MTTAPQAPELQCTQWFNTDAPVTLAALRGKVVVIEAFQMLCPGCVSHGLPLAKKVHQALGAQGVAVVGLHTVFEHHDAMQPHALQAFLYEYKIRFPVGVDAPVPDSTLPSTMARWGLQGTPSLLLFDKSGRLRAHQFGNVDELQLGVFLGQLLEEAPNAVAGADPTPPADGCNDQGCAAPAAR